MPDEDIFNLNWQNWRWYPAKYTPELERAERGEARYAEEIQQQKAVALMVANQCITDLERARNTLSEKDYRILHTRLVSNKAQLEFRSLAAMAALHSRRITAATSDAERKAAMELFLNDYLQADKLQAELKTYPAPRRFNYLGKIWTVDYPLGISPEVIATWMNGSQ